MQVRRTYRMIISILKKSYQYGDAAQAFHKSQKYEPNFYICILEIEQYFITIKNIFQGDWVEQ